MSGGVDSSVAALLLKQQGYTVAGVYMKTWMNEGEVFADCPWQTDRDDARAVASQLGMDFAVVNMVAEYRKRIVEYLVAGYKSGITPNPDILCNREIKFGALFNYARKRGFDAVATGHYCQKEQCPDQTYTLLEGRDKNKDQSYFLALITQEQLRQIVFPLGELQKPQVKAIALRHGFPNAEKKESQGICFLHGVKINDFLSEYLPENPGDIVNHQDRVVGRHRGLHRYTLGQRRGIGVPSNTDNEHYVVVGKDREQNRLLVAFDHPQTPDLYTQEVEIAELSFINKAITKERALLAKPRYRDPSTEITFHPLVNNRAKICFKKPQRALSPGQVLALYDSERLLGGGFYV